MKLDRWVILLFVTLTGLFSVYSAFYPGLMSADSIAQLSAARTGVYTDWHPPIMSLVWGLLDRLYPGPFLLIVFHNLLFWLGTGWIFLSFLGPRIWTILVILGVGLSPPIFAVLGTAWKDVGLGCSLVFSVGLLVLSDREMDKKKKRGLLAGAILAIFYAISVRHNAAPAALPLLIWGSLIYIGGTSVQWLRRNRILGSICMAMVLFVPLISTSILLTKYLTKNQTSYPIQQILLHDLAAISVDRGELIFPKAYLENKNLTLDTIRQNYTPTSLLPLFCCNTTKVYFPSISDASDIHELKVLWFGTVYSNGKSYLRHRWRVLKAQLGVDTPPAPPFHTGIDQNYLGVVYSQPNLLGKLFWKIMKRTAYSPLFRSWYWLVLGSSLMFFVLLNRKRYRQEGLLSFNFYFFTLLSGLFYSFPYFFVSTNYEFRMLWWSVVSTLLVSSVFGLKEFHNRRRPLKKQIGETNEKAIL